MEKITVFCLPFAGGNKYSYRAFSKKTSGFLNFITLEYPGRGSRLEEPFYDDINDLVLDLYQQLKKHNDGNSYAIYGHSLGGMLTCLLSQLIVAENEIQPPCHVFISGSPALGAALREKKRHLLSTPEFIEELRSLEGCPEEILNSEELLAFFLPILRADFAINDTYVYSQNNPLNICFTVITGTDEPFELNDLRMWQYETTRPVDFLQMPGGHFFIYSQLEPLVKVLEQKLLNVIA